MLREKLRQERDKTSNNKDRRELQESNLSQEKRLNKRNREKESSQPKELK